MWINEKCPIDFELQDSFGYSVLDYSIVYNKIHCFMFLVFKCGLKKLSSKHLDHISEVLCKNPSELSKKFVTIIMNDKELSK